MGAPEVEAMALEEVEVEGSLFLRAGTLSFRSPLTRGVLVKRVVRIRVISIPGVHRRIEGHPPRGGWSRR